MGFFRSLFKVAAVALGAAAVVFSAGAALGITAGWSSVAGGLGGLLGEGALGSIVSGAIQYAGYGAITGGIASAIGGRDILKGMTSGALMGGITGGILGGLSAADIYQAGGLARPTPGVSFSDLFQAPAPTAGVAPADVAGRSGEITTSATPKPPDIAGGEGTTNLSGGGTGTDTLGTDTLGTDQVIGPQPVQGFQPGDITLPQTAQIQQNAQPLVSFGIGPRGGLLDAQQFINQKLLENSNRITEATLAAMKPKSILEQAMASPMLGAGLTAAASAGQGSDLAEAKKTEYDLASQSYGNTYTNLWNETVQGAQAAQAAQAALTGRPSQGRGSYQYVPGAGVQWVLANSRRGGTV